MVRLVSRAILSRRKDAKYGLLFIEYLSSEDDKGAQFSDLPNKFLTDDERFSVPGDLNLPKLPLRHISFIFQYQTLVQISAQGVNLWKGNTEGTSLRFSVKELGGSFRAIKTAEKTYSYDVHLRGFISIYGYNGFTAAMATLDLGPDSDRTLIAILGTRTGANAAAVSDLASSLSKNESEKWSVMAPTAEPLSFDGLIQLYINFKEARFVVAGAIQKVGSAILMGRRHPVNQGQRGYFFALSATNLETIFPAMKEAISNLFTISRVAIQVLT